MERVTIEQYFFLPGNEPNEPRGSNSSNPLVSLSEVAVGGGGIVATGGGGGVEAIGGGATAGLLETVGDADFVSPFLQTVKNKTNFSLISMRV